MGAPRRPAGEGALKGPWYLSARAVREYLALMRRKDDDGGPEWSRAEDELRAMAENCLERERTGIRLPRPHRGKPDLIVYRGPSPLRLQLIVSTTKRPEGDLPQLVSVSIGHDTRRKP